MTTVYPPMTLRNDHLLQSVVQKYSRNGQQTRRMFLRPRS